MTSVKYNDINWMMSKQLYFEQYFLWDTFNGKVSLVKFAPSK